MKRCFKCKEIKSLSEFYKNKSRKDGFQHCCINCQKVYEQTNKGKEYHRKAIRKYRKSIKGKAANKRCKLSRSRQIKAINAVNHAKVAGKIPRPDTLQCSYGNHPAEQYHHYKGYEPEFRLDIIPVCRKCHAKIHKHKKEVA